MVGRQQLLKGQVTVPHVFSVNGHTSRQSEPACKLCFFFNTIILCCALLLALGWSGAQQNFLQKVPECPPVGQDPEVKHSLQSPTKPPEEIAAIQHQYNAYNNPVSPLFCKAGGSDVGKRQTRSKWTPLSERGPGSWGQLLLGNSKPRPCR